MALYRKFGEII